MGDRLEGKVALITGTAGGQGRAAALHFAREGATVVGCDVKADDALETVHLVREAGGSMTSSQPLDLGDPDQARDWIDDAAAEHGGFDILYNNASAVKFAPVDEFTDADWHFTIRNEIHLVFYACRAAWPHLIRRGGGVIINTASISGLKATGHLARGCLGHAATKGAVLGMTRELALEGAPHNIRVNAISPGPIATPATAAQLEDPAFRGAVLDSLLIKRFGESEDIAPAAVFLASDESSWMTGENITIDGGFMAW